MARNKILPSDLFVFCLVTLIAAFFRCRHLDLIEFKGDEAVNLYLAARPYFSHPFPPGGTVSSIGLINPPFFNYLLLPLIYISRNPKALSFLIGLTNSLSIGFFYFLIKRYFKKTTALLASLLFALSPWAILFSRKIWTQNLLVPFVLLMLYSLLKIVIDKKQAYWWVLAMSQLLIIQLHQPAIFLIAIINLWIWLRKIKPHWKYLTLGFFLGALPLIPYLAFILQNIQNPQVFLIPKQRFSDQFFPSIFLQPLQILGQGGFHFVLGTDTLTFAQKFPFAYQLRKFFYLEYFLLPIGICLLWRKKPKLKFLIYPVIGLPIIYFLLRFRPFIHYFISLLPLLFLFLGIVFHAWFKHSKLWWRRIGYFTYSILVIASLLFNQSFYSLLKQEISLTGDYGISFIEIEQKTNQIYDAYQLDPHHEEMILASWLPIESIIGSNPIAKMIYSNQDTQLHLTELEDRLKQIPIDRRVQNQLIAFYSWPPPTATTVKYLKSKSLEIPGYKLVYKEIDRYYFKIQASLGQK